MRSRWLFVAVALVAVAPAARAQSHYTPIFTGTSYVPPLPPPRTITVTEFRWSSPTPSYGSSSGPSWSPGPSGGLAQPTSAAPAAPRLTVAELEKVCEQGKADYCATAAWRHERGDGTPESQSAALRLYDRACTLGDINACEEAGQRWAAGRGGGPDDERARAVFTKACDAGRAASCTRLGWALAKGRGGPRDEVGARRLFKLACDAGHGQGCIELGHMQREGRGGPRDTAAAFTLFDRACAARVHDGCELRKDALLRGEGTAEEGRRAASTFEALCGRGEDGSCYELGELLEHGAPGVKADPARAASLYRPLCAKRQGVACGMLGALAERGVGEPGGVTRAMALYDQGCGMQDAWSCVVWARMRLSHGGDEKSGVRAVNALRRWCKMGYLPSCNELVATDGAATGLTRELRAQAAEQLCQRGEAFACERLATWLRSGDGIAPAPTRAAQLDQKACDAGFVRSCARYAGDLFDGGAVKADPAAALRLASWACEENSADACVLVGKAHAAGHGTARDEAAAATHFQRACKLGNGGACVLAIEGAKAGVDAATVAELDKLCRYGTATACLALARIWERGAAGLPARPAWARIYRESACRQHVKEACGSAATTTR